MLRALLALVALTTFAHADTTWQNGQSRQTSFPLAKVLGDYLVPSLYMDIYYAFSTNRPIDHTLTGTASVARHNELTVNVASAGLEWNYQNVIGRILLQWGAMTKVIQDFDPTTQRGVGISTDAYRYLREATVGYHFDAAEGVNIEAGIFMSYVGLESYLLAENWSYNRSLLSEFTPFYFTGLRTQIFATKTLKIEPWLMNGYQTYGKWNEAPSAGMAMKWTPSDAVAVIGNVYVGTDTREVPDRVRFHHDHSLLVRVYDDPEKCGLSKLAVSLNNHAGFESGGPDGSPGPSDAHFLGSALSVRAWFARNFVATTVRGEVLTHPSGYSTQFPPPGFDAANGFELWGLTVGAEIMPRDFFSLRAEVLLRRSSIPFFTGRGGITSEDGYQDSASPNFEPELAKRQLTFTVAANFRL